MRARMPWWEGVKLVLLTAGLYVAWLLYQRLSQTATTVDKAAAPITGLSNGINNLLSNL